MFKRTLAMLAGAALLTTAATTESRTVGLENIGTTLIVETGDPLVTVLGGLILVRRRAA